MKASPEEQQRLLDLQALDSGIDRLDARRRGLPELAEIARLDARFGEVRDALVLAETEVSDIGRAQSRLETEVDLVRTRSTRDQQRLGSGAAGSAKELENLQSEIASLARRQGVLEDDLLEVMQTREDAESRAHALRSERDGLGGQRDSAESARDGAFTAIDAERGGLAAERSALAPELPADLLALYERVRKASGGVGAAALLRRRCQGCHLELSGADLNAVKAAPPDEVVRCEECRRILVRTPESGLA